MTGPLVPISAMPRELHERLPETYRVALQEAGCEFDRLGHRFVRDRLVVAGYDAVRDCTSLGELRALLAPTH